MWLSYVHTVFWPGLCHNTPTSGPVRVHKSWAHIRYDITLLPSVNTLIAQGMFRGAKYTHHTFTPIIKHLITATANKHPGKKSFIDKNMKNPTGIKLCVSHKIKWPLPEDPLLKVTVLVKAIIRIIYNKLINPVGLFPGPLSP